MVAALSIIVAAGPAGFGARARGAVAAPGHASAALVVAVLVGSALVLAAVVWLVMSRFVASRRRRTEAITAVYREIRMAMADPILVHQARRRIRESQARDR